MSAVLVLYWHPTGNAMRSAVEHHLRALERYAARGRVEYLNSYDESAPSLQIGAYEALVLHTTFLTQRWGDAFGLFKQRFAWISEFPRTKIAIPQDEYDHPEILDEWLYELDVKQIFTNFDAARRAPLYPILAEIATFHECLTGYIDPDVAEWCAPRVRPLRARSVDIVYRATNLPFWFGRHGQLKHRVGESVAAAAARRGLTTDISTSNDDVIYGDAWFDFMLSGRAVAGAESGSSALARRGEVQSAIRAMLAETPELTFDEVEARLPPGWDGHGLTALSPRHFEAVITRTAQVLVEGTYSGVFEAGRHYVPIRADLSEIDESLAALEDLDALERMTQRAYDEIYQSGRYTYAAFAEQLAAVVYAGAGTRPGSAASRPDARPAPRPTPTALGGNRPLSILVLCDDSRAHAGNLREHLAAFTKYSRHRVHLFSTVGVVDSRFLELDAVDVVVLHYSLVITGDTYLSPALREKVRAFKGLKVQFLQDEYRWVDEITAMMRYLEIDVLFSIVPTRELEQVYGGRLPGTEIIPTLAGFVPEALATRRTPPLARRPIDVGYRGRVLPYWNGALSQEKVWMAQGFARRVEGTGLRTDIAWGENDRLYGSGWARFLSSCKATLGTESGTSITDFDGSIEAETCAYLVQHPGASFAEVTREVLKPYERNVMMNVVSPRLFEAAALRTAMVMFPGEYGGTVEPWDHYVPLEKDFSNFDAVTEALRDVPALTEMTWRAHADLIASGRYSLRTFVREFDEMVADRAKVRGTGATRGFVLARAERPFTTGTVAGYDLRGPLRLGAWSAGLGRLLAEDAVLRRLVVSYARQRDLRGRVRPKRLAEDLIRLGLLRRAHADEPRTTDRFYVDWRWEEESSTLVFVSVAADSPPPPPRGEIPWDAVRVILWDHRQVALLVRHPVGLGKWRAMAVGYYGVIGIHHFGALGEMLREDREAVEDAFAPVEAPPAWTRSSAAAAQGSVVAPPLAQFVTAPRNYAAKAHLLAVLFARKPWLRAIFAAHNADATLRSHVPRRTLIEDLVKLHAVEEARSGRVGTVARVDLHHGAGTLRLVTQVEGISYADAWPALDPAEPLGEIVWDNRAYGDNLRFPTRILPRLEIAAGTEGVYRFEALEAIARRHPGVVRQAFGKRPGEVVLARRLRSAPRNYLAKAVLVGGLLVKRRELRRLWRAYRSDRALRTELPEQLVLEDLLKLFVLEEARSGRVGAVARVDALYEEGTLRFVTQTEGVHHTGSWPALDPAGPLERILWDNRAVGAKLRFPSPVDRDLEIAAGDGGLHRFVALEMIAARHPDVAREALGPSELRLHESNAKVAK